MDYKQSGVDINAGNEVVRRIADLARSTFTPGVLSEIGLFGGLFQLDTARLRDPVLVASVDGVGTKLQVAFLADQHRTIGSDLVNHCVNDILVQGAEPLFFLDYLATGRLSPDKTADVMAGIVEGCRANACALLGGETAEMPGFYREGEYDLAGFIVGVVERQRIVDGRTIRIGDRLIGLSSTGLHTNGFSLARRILFDRAGLAVRSFVPELDGTVEQALLRPHRSYLSVIRPVLSAGLVKGMAHITGGGLTDNIPRVLPDGLAAVVDRSAWRVPRVFRYLQERGDVAEREMFRVFNMGIGLVLVCASEAVAQVMTHLADAGEADACVIGSVIAGPRSVVYR